MGAQRSAVSVGVLVALSSYQAGGQRARRRPWNFHAVRGMLEKTLTPQGQERNGGERSLRGAGTAGRGLVRAGLPELLGWATGSPPAAADQRRLGLAR